MTELKSKEDVEALINKEGIEYVSVRFTDLYRRSAALHRAG